MQCQWEAHYDDMYPEFAPDPIVVRCAARATHHALVAETMADEGGYPRPGQREVVHQWACAEHAPEFDAFGADEMDAGYWNSMFDARVLSVTVSG
jgi:hypothetical protein